MLYNICFGIELAVLAPSRKRRSQATVSKRTFGTRLPDLHQPLPGHKKKKEEKSWVEVRSILATGTDMDFQTAAWKNIEQKPGVLSL